MLTILFSFAEEESRNISDNQNRNTLDCLNYVRELKEFG